MIKQANGHKRTNGESHGTIERIVSLEDSYWAKRRERDAQNTYHAGESDRMNPVPKGIDPLGTDADYHYRTSRNYYLMVERGRAAVRNHPLVEQGINRLIANLKLGEFTLDVDSGDPEVDKDQKDFWRGWGGETAGGRNECDYEGTRTFQQLARQSFFSQVQDGDILHLPLLDGRLQTWESHHIRSPYRHMASGLATDGIVHGAEVRDGQIVAYHITPEMLFYGQSVSRWMKTRRIPAFDEEGNKVAFWLGFRHRFYQRRGISRLAAPRDAMTGFDDLNYAHIKSALRRSLISYLMKSTAQPGQTLPFQAAGGPGRIPQAGNRYTQPGGLGLESTVIEQAGEPAQVHKPPEGYTLEGWNANLPGNQFFEHSALLLTMLAVNLDMPLMFLLLDGSLVNFHGGRMTFDQAKLRFRQLQLDQIQGLWAPTYEWKTRQRITPGSKQFDPALAAAVKRGANPFNYKFRPAAWPYVKPLEDAAGEDLSEKRNLRSMRCILGDRGVDLDEHREEVIPDRQKWYERAIEAAIETTAKFPQLGLSVEKTANLYAYGTDPSGVQLSIAADQGSGETTAATKPKQGSDDGA